MNLEVDCSFRRRVMGVGCILAALFLLAGAWVIPFVFESSSILYKFGMDKLLLRSAKIFGLTAAVMIFYQVLVMSRFKMISSIFPLKRLYMFHKVNGVVLAFFVLFHPILIVFSENFTFFTFEKKYWPEWLGSGLLVFFLFVILTAIWRNRLAWAYKTWLRWHRFSSMAIVLVMLVHIFFVSDTFASGLPRQLVFIAGGLYFLLFSRIWYYRLFAGRLF
jgi:predicted ferric reductase